MKSEDIINLPNVRLRQRSKKVGLVNEQIRKLTNDMQSALLDWEAGRKHEVGVALAAVQVDALFKIIIIRNNFDNKNDHSFGVFINPEITKYEGVIEKDYEGCLSIVDIYGLVPRHTKVRVKALDLNGRIVRMKAEGFLARIFQHEIDHNNGVVFIDHIKEDHSAFFYLSKEGELASMNYDEEVKGNKVLWS